MTHIEALEAVAKAARKVEVIYHKAVRPEQEVYDAMQELVDSLFALEMSKPDKRRVKRRRIKARDQ